MALTPEAVLLLSPGAKLTAEELADADGMEAQIDAHITGRDATGPRSLDNPPGWNGLVVIVEMEVLPPRLMAEIIRRYSRAGWTVTFDPIAGTAKGPRGEPTVGGHRLQLQPKWGRVDRPMTSSASPVDARELNGHVDRHIGGGS